MVLNCKVEYLFEKLGHDGGEIIWPNLGDPLCRRGHHIEELQYIALGFGFILTPFAKAFDYAPDIDLPSVRYDFSSQFDWVLRTYDCILLGQWKRGSPHAVAWNAAERLIYDPEGITSNDFHSFELDQCFAALPSRA